MENDFSSSRAKMVEEQLVKRGVKDELVIDAMRKIPRHLFVPENCVRYAYDDNPIPIGDSQTISQPFMVAIMTEALALTATEKVLEIGTGSGYQTAVLAELSFWVYTVERLTSLHNKAVNVFDELGYENVTSLVSDGTIGLQKYQPYDAIIVTAGAPKIPETLVSQLVDGGRIVIPLGNLHYQELIIATKSNDMLEKKHICDCRFVPLYGEHGWQE